MEQQFKEFIEKLLFDMMALDFHYYQEPFADISTIDRYLRRGLQSSEKLYDYFKTILYQAKSNTFHIICDKYLLQYIIFRPYADRTDVISVGPYISRPVDNDFFNHIADLNHLDYSEMESLKNYLYSVPMFDNNLRIITVINDILNYLNHEPQSFEIKNVSYNFEDMAEEDYKPQEDFEIFVDTVQKRYDIEEQLLNAIANGNQVEAMLAARAFRNFPFEQRLKDALHDKRQLLYSVNTLLRKGAQPSAVHPVYLHEISSKFARKIDEVTDIASVEKLHEKMVREYCLLVKNKARIQYTPLIRSTINYIEFNLSTPLSLSSIADKLHVSPPYLSNLFKKETGTTITDYINQQRIHIALKLITTSSMQIQTIASYVGINDVNYFTKLFKKQVGCTPREYRKQLHS